MGLAISDFWETTPYELSIILNGYAERKHQEHDAIISQAWLTAMWTRQKKMPSLKSVLEIKPKAKKMTDDAMMKMCMSLNKMFGGKEVKVNGN